MLEIDKEFRKGILFVRLKGILNKETVSYLNKEVTKMVADMEIRNVVFNIKELSYIDLEGLSSILYTYNLCREYNGISMLCNVNEKIKDEINHSLLSDMFQTKDETAALNMIEI